MTVSLQVLGFDPDFHNSGIALVRYYQPEGLSLRVARVVSVGKNESNAVGAMVAALPPARDIGLNEWWHHAVFESQEERKGKDRKSDGTAAARSPAWVLVGLGQITGAAARLYFAGEQPEFVLPSEWKHSVKKEVKQARICTYLGWGYEMRAGWALPTGPGPEQFPHIKGKQWSHVLDAIGIAIWKIEQLTGLTFGKRYGQ